MKTPLKMKLFKYLFLFVISLTISMASCSKKDEATISKSQSELLTSHQWKLSSITLNGAVSVIDECKKDDHFSWSANGIWTDNPGLVLCYGNEKVTSGTFSLSVDMKTIIYGGYDAQYNVHDDIIELTENKLVLTHSAEGFKKTYVPY